MEFSQLDPPASGSRIDLGDDGLVVPFDPIIPFIVGDGIGPDVWAASRPVLDAAVEEAFGGQRKLHWYEIFAGQEQGSSRIAHGRGRVPRQMTGTVVHGSTLSGSAPSTPRDRPCT